MDREAAKAGKKRARQPGRAMVVLHALGLASSGLVVWLTRSLDHWNVAPLVVLGAFLTVTILTDLATGASKVRISGGLIGLMVAIAILGPGPAAVLAVTMMAVSWMRTRVAAHFARNN